LMEALSTFWQAMDRVTAGLRVALVQRREA
jgi:hypothetical protein